MKVALNIITLTPVLYICVCDYCLPQNEQIFSYIMARTSYIFNEMMMRSALHQTNSRGQTNHSTWTHYPDSDQTSLCSYSLMLHAQRRSNKYQFNSPRFYPTVARTLYCVLYVCLYACDPFYDCFVKNNIHNRGNIF